jgi:DNA-directed RNA polymerase specialized sigma24 family protein
MTDTTAPSSAFESLAATSDNDLAVAAHEGSADAALALIDRYTPAVFNLVLRATGMTPLAEETTRDVLADEVRHLAERVPPPDRRWIVTLAAQVYRRFLAMEFRPEQRTHRVRISPRLWRPERLESVAAPTHGETPSPIPATTPAAIPAPTPGPAVTAKPVTRKLRRRLAEAWSRLTMRQRFVLTLVELHKLSIAELAEVLGESEPVARRLRDDAKLALMVQLSRRSDDRARRPSPPAAGPEKRP